MPPEKRFHFFSPSPDGETLRGFFDKLGQLPGKVPRKFSPGRHPYSYWWKISAT